MPGACKSQCDVGAIAIVREILADEVTIGGGDIPHSFCSDSDRAQTGVRVSLCLRPGHRWHVEVNISGKPAFNHMAISPDRRRLVLGYEATIDRIEVGLGGLVESLAPATLKHDAGLSLPDPLLTVLVRKRESGSDPGVQAANVSGVCL